MVSPGKRLGPGQSTGNIPFKANRCRGHCAGMSARWLPWLRSHPRVLKAIFGNQNWSTQVTGSDNQYFRVTNRSIRAGRQFSESELRAGAAVCIVGETVRKKLFGGQEALGEKIRLAKALVRGDWHPGGKGQSTMGMDQDDIVVIPLRTYQRRIAGNQDVASHSGLGSAGRLDRKGPAGYRATDEGAASSIAERRRQLQCDGHEGNHQNAHGDHATAHCFAECRGGGQPSGRRHRHHEHHAGIGY